MSPVHSLITGNILGVLMREAGTAGSMFDAVEPVVDEHGNYTSVIRVKMGGSWFLLAVMEE